MTHEHTTTWFLAQLRPNCAAIAQRNLDRQKFQTFLPLERDTRQRNGKFENIMRPLFPGYIFVALDRARGLWRSVNSTYGVTRLVSFGEAPAPVPNDLVAALRERCDDRGLLLPPATFHPGDTVTLNSGPFAKFVAEVEKVGVDQRVWILLDFMGRQTRVLAEPQHLKAV